MIATIADIIQVMETIAPIRIAEEWDNVGLQIGQEDRPVQCIWVALDPSPHVVDEACRNGVDLLITHHPLIFKPLKSVKFNTTVGSIIKMAIQHQLSLFVAHTNLDNATDGLNDLLARRIGLENLKVLGNTRKTDSYKLVVYVPVEYEQKVLNALFETKAGEIGPYTCCSFRNNGIGTFRPESSAKPFSGKIEEISLAEEVRIETIVKRNDLDSVIKHIRKSHPYETMAYDIYTLLGPESKEGLGRVGTLDKSTDFDSFTMSIKEKLELNSIKVTGNPDLIVNTVAVCSGSGSSLMDDFFSSGAQVYISGDLKYHDARAVEIANLGLIDIGHFASEHVMVEMLTERLKNALSENGFDVKVEASKLENDPFMIK